MKKVFIILKREYLTRVRTRAFIIGTIITPVFMLALTLLPTFLAARSSGGERQVTVLDQSGDPALFQTVQRKLSPTEEPAGVNQAASPEEQARRRTGGDARYVLTRVEVPPDQNIDELAKQYDQQVLQDSNKAYLVLKPDIFSGGKAEYNAKNIELAIRGLERAISSAVMERRLVRQNIDQNKVADAMRSVEMTTNKVTPEGKSAESGLSQFFVGLTMLIFLYTTIFVYGLSVMRGVIEEKQSRIVEVIVSSVRPTQMMLGKIIGIGLVGLTQYLIWVAAGALFIAFGVSMLASSGINMPRLPFSLLIYFVLYFVFGYFLYATLYAMVGSMVSTEEEAQQAQMPVTILIIVPMMLFTMIMANPNSPMSITLSMIPFFAPTLMMMRISMANPPMWQPLLSLALIVLTTLACTWVAARIYRVGILMYGKRPNLAELGRWLRYS